MELEVDTQIAFSIFIPLLLIVNVVWMWALYIWQKAQDERIARIIDDLLRKH